jgi:mannitol/fructose-specific phosphotransferase system IIA component (Ntr-type)
MTETNPADMPPQVSTRVPRIGALLSQEHVLLDVEASTMAEVCGILVDHVVKLGGITEDKREELLGKLLAREQASSTAIGLGAVCPHAFMDCLAKPIVLFARLTAPLEDKEAHSPDGTPADLVFLLLGRKDDAREHLESLMQVARLLQDPAFRQTAHKAETPSEVVIATVASEQRLDPKPKPSLVRAGIEQRTGRFAGGIMDDIRRRLPFYVDDFKKGLSLQGLAATVFLFFACLTAAVTFGSVMSVETAGAIGPVEMLLATAVCGVIYALFSGQPLIILGGTGPLLVFTAILFKLSEPLNVPFMPLYAWTGIWAGVFTMLLAVFDASVWMRYLTRFTDEVFVLLIAAIFIYEAIRLTVAEFMQDANYATAVSTVILVAGTFGIAMVLRQIRKSSLLRPWARNFLADFGTVIAIGAMCVVGYLMRHDTNLPHIVVPADFSLSIGDHLVPFMKLPVWAIALSALPGLFAAVLIYLDQQITARVVNSPHFNLTKGPAYHLDLGLVGLLTGLCSVLGWPWLVAATVRSLNHVAALSTTHAEDSPTGPHVVSEGVLENRVTGLGIHLLVGASLFFVPLLAKVPMACLYGIFLYMGIASLSGNQFAQRVTLWARDPELYPPTHYLRQVPVKKVHFFTLIQAACLALLWVVKTSVLAVLFPLILGLLVPIRLFLLPRWFSERYLAALDAEETVEEETDHEAGP